MKNFLNKISYNSPVVLTFTFISFLALIFGYITNGFTTGLFFSVYKSSPLSLLYYIRLFGHIFGHIDMAHFTGNFLIILLVGPMLEEKYGSKNLIEMIGLTAVITGIISVLFFNIALLGASGIVFMFILLASVTNMEKGKIPLTFILVVVFFIGKEVVNGIFEHDQISQFAHILGGVCGSLFGFILDRKRLPIK
jgi:membrane associated rhomboid family serine protease